MRLDFTKMHGTGNDFVFIDDLSEERELTGEQVRFLCDRHFGVGADGVILVRPPKRDGCVAYMHYINDDGSLAEMCGNGVRCFAKYLVDGGFAAANEGHLVVDTLAGKRAISFETDEDSRLTSATVDMGKPAFEPRLIPTTLEANDAVTRPVAGTGEHVQELTTAEPTAAEPATIEATTIEPSAAEPAVIEASVELLSPRVAFAKYSPLFDNMRLTCVNMGNPHAVAFFEGNDEFMHELDWRAVGRVLEHHPAFPERVNIEFARVIEPGCVREAKHASEGALPPSLAKTNANTYAHIEMLVWERGAGATLACGTGACAAVVAAAVTGRAARHAIVHLPGGDLRIEWLENNHVMMTGPAATVYEGTIEL